MKRSRWLVLIIVLLFVGIAYKVNTFIYDAKHLHYRPNGLDLAFDISPRGDQIVFTGAGNGKRDLYLLNLKTSHVTRLTNTPDYEGDPAFSPDGRFVAYVAGVPEKGDDCADHLYIRSLDGKTVKQLTNEDFNDEHPAFSPDGNEIVFLRANQYITGGMVAWGQWWNPQIFTIHRDGTQLRQITHSKQLYQTPQLTSLRRRTQPNNPTISDEIDGYDISSPQFSSDGKTLIFGFGDTRFGNRHDIASIDLTQNVGNWSQGIQLLTQDGHSALPTVSSDGKYIIFMFDFWRSSRHYYNFHEMKNDGTGRMPVMKLGMAKVPNYAIFGIAAYPSMPPKPSPDGKFIYFLVQAMDLYRMDTNGKNLVKIADGALFADPLSWKPTQK